MWKLNYLMRFVLKYKIDALDINVMLGKRKPDLIVVTVYA